MKDWKLKVRDFKFKNSYDLPSGCSGDYYKIARGLGVKVYRYGNARNPKSLVGSSHWWVAANAMHTMNIANKKGLAPRAHGVTIIKRAGFYHVALVMEHISGTHPHSMDYNKFREKLSKVGLEYNDLGTHNAIRKRDGTVVIIDFDHVGKNK